MSFSFVDSGDNALTVGATTITVVKTLSAGGSLAGGVTWQSSGGTSVTVADSQGNTYTQVGSTKFETNGPTAFATFYCSVATGGVTTITATYNGSRQNRGIGFCRYTGLGASQVGKSNEQNPGVT